VDTTNILFICGGAFVGARPGHNRSNDAQAIRVRDEPPEVELVVTAASCMQTRSEDLIKFGMIPEFVGRFPVITTLSDLDVLL